MAQSAHVLGTNAARSFDPRVGLDDVARVLVLHVAADAEFALRIAEEMTAAGHDVGVFTIERTVVDRAARDNPDLTLLVRSGESFSLPRICAALREVLDCRIIVIDFTTAPAGPPSALEELRLVETLDAGADDYMSGMASPSVLHARVRAALRARPPRRRKVGPIEIGDVLIDLQAHALFIAGTVVACPRIQFNVLVALASRPNELVTRDALIATVWGLAPDSIEPQRVRTAISQVRRTLGRGPLRPRVETVARLGYRLAVGESGQSVPSLGSAASTSR